MENKKYTRAEGYDTDPWSAHENIPLEEDKASHSTDTDKGEVFRWVKASERLPEKSDNTIVWQHTHRPISGMGYNKSPFRQFHSIEKWHNDEIEFIEWLEKVPTDKSNDLEKEIAIWIETYSSVNSLPKEYRRGYEWAVNSIKSLFLSYNKSKNDKQ